MIVWLFTVKQMVEKLEKRKINKQKLNLVPFAFMNMQELSPAVQGFSSPFFPSIQSSPSQCRQLIGGAEKKIKIVIR